MSNRKRVVWKKSPDTGHQEQKALRPRVYIPDTVLSEEVTSKITPNLYKGALWRVASPWFSDIPEPAGFELPPYPYAQGTDFHPYSKLIYKQGTYAVYLGTTRVEEWKHGGQSLSVPRHTFMLDGKIFMGRRLTDLEPVV